MADYKKNVELVIKAKNDTSAALKSVESDLKKIAKAGGDSKQAASGMVSILNDLNSNLKKLTPSSTSMELLGDTAKSASIAIDALNISISENSAKLQELKIKESEASSATEKARQDSQKLRQEYENQKQKLDDLIKKKLELQKSGTLTARSKESQQMNAEISTLSKSVADYKKQLREVDSVLTAATQNENKTSRAVENLTASIERQNNALAVSKNLIKDVTQAQMQLERASQNAASAGVNRNAQAIAGFNPSPARIRAAESLVASRAVNASSGFNAFAARTGNLNPVAPEAPQNVSTLTKFLKMLGVELNSTTQASGKATTALNQVDGAVRKTGDGSRQALSYTQRLRGEMLSMATTAIGLYAALNQASDALNTYNQRQAMVNGLMVANKGDRAATASDLAYIKSEADRLGIAINQLGGGFTKFSVAAAGAGVSSYNTKKIFTSVAEAGRVMNLSAEDSNGIFLALTQMMSKGKIQAEELRGQLGERLPGAFNLMAEALGVTVGELNNMLDKGQVLANEDTFVKFADVMTAKFSGQLPAALRSLSSDLGRLQNAWQESQLIFAENGFADSIQYAAKALTDFLKSAEGQTALKALAQEVGALIMLFTDIASFVSTASSNLVGLGDIVKFVIALSFAKEVQTWAGSLAAAGAAALDAASATTTATGAIEGQAAAAKGATLATLGWRLAIAAVIVILGSFIMSQEKAKLVIAETQKKADNMGVSLNEAAIAYSRASTQSQSMATNTGIAGKNAATATGKFNDMAGSLDRIATAAANAKAEIAAMTTQQRLARIAEIDKYKNDPMRKLGSGIADVYSYSPTIVGAQEELGTSKVVDIKGKTNLYATAKGVVAHYQKNTPTNDHELYQYQKALDYTQKIEAGNALDSERAALMKSINDPTIVKKEESKVYDTSNVSNGSGNKTSSTGGGNSAAKLADLKAQADALKGEVSKDTQVMLDAVDSWSEAQKLKLKEQFKNASDYEKATSYIDEMAAAKKENILNKAQKKAERASLTEKRRKEKEADDLQKDLTYTLKLESDASDAKAKIKTQTADEIKKYELDAIDSETQARRTDAIRRIDDEKLLQRALIAIAAKAAAEKQKIEEDFAKKAADALAQLAKEKTDFEISQTGDVTKAIPDRQQTLAKEQSDKLDKLKPLLNEQQFADAKLEIDRQYEIKKQEIERDAWVERMNFLNDQLEYAKSQYEKFANEYGTKDERTVGYANSVKFLKDDLKEAVEQAEKLNQELSGPNAKKAQQQIDNTREQSLKPYTKEIISAEEANRQMAQAGVDAIDAWANAVVNGEDAWKAFGDTFRKELASFLSGIAKAILQQQFFNILQGMGLGGYVSGTANKMGNSSNGFMPGTGPAADVLKNIFKSGSTTSAGGGFFKTAFNFVKGFFGHHEGGIVGSEPTFFRSALAMSDLPKFHTGGMPGLSSDEQMIIAQKGEGVFTKGQMKALGNGMNGSKGDVVIHNNFDSEDVVSKGMNTPKGVQTLVNVVKDNKSVFKGLLG